MNNDNNNNFSSAYFERQMNLLDQIMDISRDNISAIETVSKMMESISHQNAAIAEKLSKIPTKNNPEKDAQCEKDHDAIQIIIDILTMMCSVVFEMENRLRKLEGDDSEETFDDMISKMMLNAMLKKSGNRKDDEVNAKNSDEDEDFEVTKLGDTTIKKMVVDTPEKLNKMFKIVMREGGADAVDKLLDDLNSHDFFNKSNLFGKSSSLHNQSSNAKSEDDTDADNSDTDK